MTPRSLSFAAAFAACFAACIAAAPLVAQVRWQSRLPARASQSLRFHSKSACFDTRRKRVLCLDELAGTNVRFALYRLDSTTRTWLGDFPGKPSGTIRLGYDRKRDRVVCLIEVLGARFETWEWDQSSWRRSVTSSSQTLASSEADLLWDEARQRIVHVHNGTPGSGRFGVYEYDGRAWTERRLAAAPATATSYSSAIDDAGRILLYAIDDVRQTPSCWWMDGGRWLAVTGTVPPSRTSAALCFDPTRRRFVLHGGQWQRQGFAETWEWNGSWQQRKSAGGPARWGHSLVYAEDEARLVGGFTFLRSSGIRTHDEVFGYRVLQPARASAFGTACGGPNAPTLDVKHLPWIGEDAGLTITSASSASASLLFTGASRQRWGSIPLPLDLSAAGMPACSLLLSPDLALATTTPTIRYRIPPQSGLVGTSYFHQVASLVRSANPAGLTWSKATELRIGTP